MIQTSVHSTGTASPTLSEKFNAVSGFTWSFSVSEPSYLIAFGHVDTKHLGIAGTANKAIMVAFQLKLNGSWLAGSKTGENIVGVEGHYYAAQIHGFKQLNPGNYTIELHSRSASTAAPGVDGLAAIKGTYNQVVYMLVPVS